MYVKLLGENRFTKILFFFGLRLMEYIYKKKREVKHDGARRYCDHPMKCSTEAH